MMQLIPKPPPKDHENVRYGVEHVLEANLIQTFFKQLPDAKETCQVLKAAKFESGDMNLGVRPINYVGGGWPSKEINVQRDETFHIFEPVNLVKQKLWLGTRFNGEAAMAKLVMTEDTMPQAIKTMKFAITTYKYMLIPRVQEILISHTDRVAQRLDEAEEWMRVNEGYRKRNLGTKFKAYVKGRFDVVMGRLDAFFTTYDPLITGILGDDDDPANDDAGRADLRQRINVVHEAIENTQGTFTNPFP